MQKCFLLLFLLPAYTLTAQVVLPALLEVRNLKPVPIELEKKKAVTPTSFTSFSIEDVRQDTTTVGYVKFTPDYKKFNRLEFENGTSSAALFLNRYFQTNFTADTLRLVIVLKNFFLTQEYKSTGFISLANVVYVSKAFVAARLLVQNGKRYSYLGEVDTVMAIQKWLGKSYSQLVQTALLQIVRNGEQLLQQSSARTVSYDEFIAASKSSSTGTHKWKDGFYRSYADFLKQQSTTIAYQFEQRKKVKLIKTESDADTSLVQNGWGFVENGTLYVRNGNFYIPMRASFGSYSGLGVSFTEADKVPIAGVLLQNPLMIAADMADLAINGPVAKMEHYRLFKLNTETGDLE